MEEPRKGKFLSQSPSALDSQETTPTPERRSLTSTISSEGSSSGDSGLGSGFVCLPTSCSEASCLDLEFKKWQKSLRWIPRSMGCSSCLQVKTQSSCSEKLTSLSWPLVPGTDSSPTHHLLWGSREDSLRPGLPKTLGNTDRGNISRRPEI